MLNGACLFLLAPGLITRSPIPCNPVGVAIQLRAMSTIAHYRGRRGGVRDSLAASRLLERLVKGRAVPGWLQPSRSTLRPPPPFSVRSRAFDYVHDRVRHDASAALMAGRSAVMP